MMKKSSTDDGGSNGRNRTSKRPRLKTADVAPAVLLLFIVLSLWKYQEFLNAFLASSTFDASVPPSHTQAVLPETKFLDVFSYLCRSNISATSRMCNLTHADHVSHLLGNVLADIQSGPGLHFTSPLHPNKMLVPPPPAYREGTYETLDCGGFARRFQKTSLANPVFEVNATIANGNLTLPTPRTILDVVLINNELDTLEARLYELNHVVDYFVVVESSYNHRGVQKPRLLQRNLPRFAPFLDKLLLLDADDCPTYMKFVTDKREHFHDEKVCGKNEWDIQNSMRDCIWPLLKAKLADSRPSLFSLLKKNDNKTDPLPDDTLIAFSDLDEIPSSTILHHIKHCKPRGLDFEMPFLIQLSHRSTHRPTLDFQAIPPSTGFWLVWVQSISHPRKFGKLAFRKDQLHQKNIRVAPTLYGGFHLQGVGSLAHYVYREFSHAEGQVNVGKVGIDQKDGLVDKNNPFSVKGGYCGVTSAVLRDWQKEYSKSPEKYFWRFAGKPGRHTPFSSINNPTPTEMESLRKAYVPWIVLENKDRYPFLWGKGTMNMYSLER